MSKLIAAFRSFAEAPDETINCENVPQEQHPKFRNVLGFQVVKSDLIFGRIGSPQSVEWDPLDSFENTSNATTLLRRITCSILEA